MSREIKSLIQPHLLGLKPYSTARDEYSGRSLVKLDANESCLEPFRDYTLPLDLLQDLHRYPDPHHEELRAKVASLRGVTPANVFVGNGSDEAIDLLVRMFCVPQKDSVVILPPTYGMYRVAASSYDIQIRRVNLLSDFTPDVMSLSEVVDTAPPPKMIFLCSPNNPTGNSLSLEKIKEVLECFPGVVVVDEAYIDFCSAKTSVSLCADYPQLVVLQTMSKAWALAGLRVGFAFGDSQVIEMLGRIKAPYNVNLLSQRLALFALNNPSYKEQIVQIACSERERMSRALRRSPEVLQVFTSDANFLLVKFKDAQGVYRRLINQGIIVRDRSAEPLCAGCLRISIGTPEENNLLLAQLECKS